MKTKDIRRSVKRAVATMGFPVGSATLFVLASFLLLTDESSLGEMSWHKWLGEALLAVGTLCLMIWGAFAFTGNPYMRRTHAVGFAYFFVIIAFLVFAVPALVVSHAVGYEPIGLISGCVRDIRASEQVRCQQRTRPGEQEGLSSHGAQPAGQGDSPSGGKAGDPGAPGALPVTPSGQPQQQTAPSRRAARNQWLVNIGGTLDPQDAAKGCDSEAAADKNKAVSNKNEAVADKRDCRAGSLSNPAYVSGGLVVPLPYLLIALTGGAVSLTRRIPEIQRCSETDHVPTDALPRLSGGAVRERLMFQILQFISSPMVALVAYQVIQPESDATSAGLAFMSGFGSEAVLQRIMMALDSAKPEATNRKPENVGTVQGIVKQQQRGVPNVEVRLEGSTIRTRSDQDGLFVLYDLPPGRQALAVTHGPMSELYPVHVVAGKVTTRGIDLGEHGTKDAAASPAGRASSPSVR